MKTFAAFFLGALLAATPAQAARHLWEVASPTHEQTFSYGSEQRRAWVRRGNHLGIVISFTNDPYVDRTEPRLYDDFSFDFPKLVLGADGRTFYYHPRGSRPVAVAMRSHGLFGDEVRLLPNSFLLVHKKHGFLTLTVVVSDRTLVASDDGSGPSG